MGGNSINSRNIEDEIRHLKSRMAELEAENSELRKELAEVKNMAGNNQPNSQIKISEEIELSDGSTKRQPASKEVRRIVNECKERPKLDADDVQDILEELESPSSRPTALRVMKKMARELPYIALGEPVRGLRRCYIIRHDP